MEQDKNYDKIETRLRRLLPTPTAASYEQGGTAAEETKYKRILLPTPVANDDNKPPEAHLAMKARMEGGPRKRITSLSVLAKAEFRQPLLPTPQARDWKGPQGAYYTNEQRDVTKRRPSDLPTASLGATTSQQSANGKKSWAGLHLNPSFVEWIMGAPLRWSDADCPLSATEFSSRPGGSAAAAS